MASPLLVAGQCSSRVASKPVDAKPPLDLAELISRRVNALPLAPGGRQAGNGPGSDRASWTLAPGNSHPHPWPPIRAT
jgi:hypothetical protein